ncbi:Btb/poz domain-containing protein [Daphnia magna]|uniref:Btb/poz domain-containing protein n=1 Tax=Daphnia magna TaxID=35525 RepID=A0A164H1J2_9CRUS|nr:Btb/poz domain-containing protein [Daphnia magna]
MVHLNFKTFSTTEYETSRQEVKFKLNDICPGLFSFHLSRTSYQPNQLGADCETSSFSFEVMVELSLENMSSCSVCSEDSYRKPTAVWASINTQKIVLEPFSPGQWKSAIKCPLYLHLRSCSK